MPVRWRRSSSWWILRQFPQPPFALLGQFQQHPSAVGFIDAAGDQLKLCHAIHKPDGGVVLDEQKIREVANGQRIKVRETPDREQRLMLLRRQTGLKAAALLKA